MNRPTPVPLRSSLGATAGLPSSASSSRKGEAPAEPRLPGDVAISSGAVARREPRPPVGSAARGFTLIEMLVSLAITMIMMGAVVSLFGIISDSVSGSRSIIEMSERLRAARNRLQTDLQGATADMRPPLRPEADQGYFELIEGPMQDLNYATSATASVMGDVDDVLMFTTRSRGEPFVGLFNGPGLTTQSQTAEVIYFCAQTLDTSSPRQDVGAPIDLTATPPIRTYTLYRRVLLVNPGLAGVMPALTNSYFTANDVSAKFVDAGRPMRPNSLGDLTKRENRFGHYALVEGSPGFPFNVGPSVPRQAPSSNATITALGDPNDSYLRFGDDVLLTNVLSFDVQVYDPDATLKSSSGGVLGPSDPGYTAAGANVGTGAYVNLGWLPTGATPNTSFSSSAFRPITTQAPLQYLTPTLPVGGAVTSWTYDTWSLHYENNGINEDGDTEPPPASRPIIDEGTDGIDNDPSGAGVGLVDDPGEQETQAPFAAPLRGIKITIRVYEPSSKQVRQVSVVQDFLAD